jgi:hypothetical protein
LRHHHDRSTDINIYFDHDDGVLYTDLELDGSDVAPLIQLRAAIDAELREPPIDVRDAYIHADLGAEPDPPGDLRRLRAIIDRQRGFRDDFVDERVTWDDLCRIADALDAARHRGRQP